KLVEVIRAADTAQWVVAAMSELGKRQTRVPVVVGDTPGFLVNLGGTAIGTEGLRIVQEGRATPSQVDAVMRDSCGFRMGPFELMDLTGIDVNFPARKIIYEGFFHDRRMTPSPYHEGLHAAGKLGRKTGGGWYAYDSKGAKIDPGADHAPSVVPAASVVVMDTQNDKLVNLVMSTGAKALGADDGKSPILVAPTGKDCTTTLGLNYPRGPLALADWLGVRNCHEILVQLQAITGDDRYRPSQWLRRRAMLGMSAAT